MADVRAKRRPQANYTPLGVSGLPRFAGYVFDEWLPELQGPRGRRVLREMSDNSAPIGALKFAMEMLIRQTSWTVAPGKDDNEGHKLANLVFTSLHDMENPWEDLLADILTEIDYGWSLFETVFKVRDGKGSKNSDGLIGWQGWQMRGQETLMRWDYENFHSNFPRAMVQLGAPDFIEHTIPMERCLLFRTTTRRSNPEGRSFWRNAYTSWYMAKHLEAIEAIGGERDMAGLPVGKVPSEILDPNASPAQKALYQAWLDLVTNIRRDEQEGVLIPSDRDEMGNPRWELTLLSTGGQRQFNLGEVIERYEIRQLMTCLGDFIMLGHGAGGGGGTLGGKKMEMFCSAVSAILDQIASQINDVAIPRLLRLNGFSTDTPPTLQHGSVERTDLDVLGNYIYQLGQSGFTLDTDPQGALMSHLLEQAHLPPPPEGLVNPYPASWPYLMPNPPGLPPNPMPTAGQIIPDATVPNGGGGQLALPPPPGPSPALPGMSTGPKRPTMQQPNMPFPRKVRPPPLTKGPLQSNGSLATQQRRARRLTESDIGVDRHLLESDVREMTSLMAHALAEKGPAELHCVAFDLDNTALRFPDVFVPLAGILANSGVTIGVITGNWSQEAREMWDSLGYPSPQFYLPHPQGDPEQTAAWKAKMCKKFAVDVLIDDFSGGRHVATFRYFCDQLHCSTVPLEVVLPLNGEYQLVGKTDAAGEPDGKAPALGAG